MKLCNLTWIVLSTKPRPSACLLVCLTSRSCFIFDLVLWMIPSLLPSSHYSHYDQWCSKSLAGGGTPGQSRPVCGLQKKKKTRERTESTHTGRFLSLHSQFLSFLPLMRREWGKIMSEGQLSAPRRRLIRTESILSKRNPPVLTNNYTPEKSERQQGFLFWTQLYTVSKVKEDWVRHPLFEKCVITSHLSLFKVELHFSSLRVYKQTVEPRWVGMSHGSVECGVCTQLSLSLVALSLSWIYFKVCMTVL